MARKSALEFLGSLALVLASVAVCLLMLEIAMRWSVPHLPLRFHKYLHDDVFVLAQHAKRGFVPQDYIAILGDSYAQGAGDWYLETAESSRGSDAFQAAHVIFEETGRDVIELGVSGAGSFDGLVYYPSLLMARLAARGYDLAAPQTIVAYFYAGNDLNNNVNLIQKYWGEGAIPDQLDGMVRFLEGLIERRRGAIEHPLTLPNRLYLTRLMKVLYDDLERVAGGWLEPARKRAKPLPPTPIRLGDAIELLPTPLHSAARDLSEEEMQHGLLLFHAALNLMRARFPEIPILLVHIPAPLAVYDLAAEEVPVDAYHGPHQAHPAAQVYARSDAICARAAEIAAEVGVTFLDVRPAIQEVARERPVHGPRDWKHFNRAGYEALGRAVAAALQTDQRDGRCRSAPSIPRPGAVRIPGHPCATRPAVCRTRA